ncbi:MAG: TauD/TfdA family dioxygenase [Myxococcota bacterium]
MPFEIRPLTAAIGAEILGVDLRSLDDAGLAELRKLWLDYKVLFFRDQDLTIEEHIAFGRRFGELERHPFAPDLPEHPEIVHIVSTKEQPYAANMWHSDVTWRKAPSLGSILRGRVIPPVGGDTCFANAVLAYERLQPEWKQRIEGLTASHDYMRVFGRRVPPEKQAAMREKYPVVHHPVVRTHPETGEKGIYTNGSFVTHVDDVAPEESQAILDHLERAIMSPNVQCRFRWEKDSIAMWDNRCTQHFATNDFWPEERRMERVTIVGDVPR